ncbi:pyrroline-5-carboxylate reductase [bacterium]|nr:pyrroline-5-carboxylate reductase [bacterium]
MTNQVQGTVGIIGCGNLGLAILRGLVLSKSLAPEKLFFVDHNPERSKKVAEQFKVTKLESISELSRKVETIICAVKPKDFFAAIAEVRQTRDNAKLISVAAGIRIADIRDTLGEQSTVVRAIPNIPCLVGAGMTGLFGTDLTLLETARSIFAPISDVYLASAEKEIDIMTSLSAGGPAFLALVAEALADGGVKMGLPRDIALQVSVQTMLGTGAFLKESREHPARLKDMVCTPNGTTIQGIHALELAGVRAAMIDAVEASAKRAMEDLG